MPWITDAAGRRFVPPPPPVIHGPLPEGVVETDPAAHRQRRREYEARTLWRKRLAVEACEIHRYCPRKACRRTGTCASPVVACHDEAQDFLDELFYPALRQELSRRKARGELADQE
jgi:hypothetical protein